MGVRAAMGRVLFFFAVPALFVILGIGVLLWQSYRIREPVYCATSSNFTFADEYLRENVSETVGDLEIREFRCFVFQGHTNRPIYEIILVGKANDKLGRITSVKNHSPTDRSMTTIFRTLELTGAAPAPDGPIREIGPHVRVYASATGSSSGKSRAIASFS